MVLFVLGHSGQRTSVKCAEASWNYKGYTVHLKSPAVLFCFVLFVCFLFVFVLFFVCVCVIFDCLFVFCLFFFCD